MNIKYSYQIINVNEQARAMEIVYASEGRETQHIGARMPFEGESLEAVVRMYSPVNFWLEQELAVSAVQEGTSGEVDLSATASDSEAPTPIEEQVAALVPEPTLEEARELKLADIANWRYGLESSGITVGNAKMQTDRGSRFAMQELAANAKASGAETVLWKTADGSFVTFAVSVFNGILQAVFEHVQEAFAQESAFVELANAAQSKQELAAIVLP